jgi:hypothetical protein
MTATKGSPTMSKRPKALHVPRSCSRCRRRLAYRQIVAGMAVLDDGRIQSTVCADCLSPEECAEMIIKEVSLEYALNVRDNRVVVRDRFRAPTGAAN